MLDVFMFLVFALSLKEGGGTLRKRGEGRVEGRREGFGDSGSSYTLYI